MALRHMLCLTIKSSVSSTVTFERLDSSHSTYISLSSLMELKICLLCCSIALFYNIAN